MTKHIPVQFIPWPGALSPKEAALYIGASEATLWRLKNRPKSDPRRIRQTSYGKYPVTELDRHLTAELERS